MTIKTERLLARAKKIAKKGEIEEAQKIYETILKDSPHNEEAKNGLLALNQDKDQLDPPKAEIDSVVALYNNGQMQEALNAVETLTKDYPNAALLFNLSGVCYKAIGQRDVAVKSFERALEIKPDYAEVFYNLGITLRELGQLDDAIRSYKKALNIKHAYPNVHNNLGNILLELRQLDTAVDHFEWAIAYQPNFAEAYNNLGITLRALGQPDTAIKNYEKALAINPDYVQAHNNLGNAFKELGESDAAIKSFEKALAIQPNYAEVHHNLSVLKKYTASDKQITIMQSLFSDSDLSDTARIYLCFALAKVYEDLGDQNKLFKVLHEGNKLRREKYNYSLDMSQNYHTTIRNLFDSSPIDIEKSLSNEAPTKRPIFIVGMLRSGTSLVEQIIASHHEVYGAGELRTLTDIVTQQLKDHLTPDLESLPDKVFLSIRKQYLDELFHFNVPEKVFTDKWPLNFRNIGFILSSLPEAKIIHLKRDARATCWSIYKHYFSDTGNAWAYNMDELTGFYSLYSELMAFWHQLFPNKIYDMNYESLTTNQEEETRKLIKYCELDWDANCLNFHTNKRAVETASTLQVRQKMYQGSSEDWKKYEEHLQPLIKALSSY